ncbi:hypothetical protein, partial [Thiolapillus sp.]|uniref:hypothetical protein n=1 Tax=Thiolapillus sp. TaxID=2017437 RepID=UPI003AF71EDB
SFVIPEISWIRVMIAPDIVFTRDFLKASRIRDYGQLKKISAPQQNLWVAEVGLRQMIRSVLSG